jgi:trehalose 6-phosphate synthase
MRRPLIVVSNRGPVSYARDDSGPRVAGRGAGGLATALRGFLQQHDVTWVASAIGAEDRAVATEAADGVVPASADGPPCRLRLLVHDPDDYDAFYNVIANPLLWFVQHSLYGLARDPTLGPGFAVAWEGYEQVNNAFADAVVAELDNEPRAAVFFHDYHLYLAPAVVRRARPDAVLAHFVHIPWPSPDMWTVLPSGPRRAIHEGLLANDVVGFHTRRWARNFLTTAAEVSGVDCDDEGRIVHGERTTAVVSHPVSVDCREFDALAVTPAVLAAEAEIVHTRSERLVVRVDRTDPSKNIVRGFVAYGLLLDRHPAWRGRVTMLALLDPSRQDIPEYADYVRALEREAAAVNGRHGHDGYLPIVVEVADDFPRAVAAYKQYDVLLVNAVFDGLNLVAKEAPLVNTRDGVLVLSENAGAHEELGEWAITVNPFDVLGQAEALHRALSLDAGERSRRARGLTGQVRANDLSRWIAALLDDLARVSA